MIAKFLDLKESVIVQKNDNSLENFLEKNLTEKEKKKDSSYLRYLLDGVHGYSRNLSDGKPGLWCSMQGTGKDISTYLFVAFSWKFRASTSDPYVITNYIFEFRIIKERNYFETVGKFAFHDPVGVEETERNKISSEFVRRAMRSSKLGHNSFLEAISKKNRQWTKNDLKGI